ncbi:hypothetical protein HBH92_002270 [Parastagonospora nodorum]|nr:hypothetical protein HBH92_002270 [Parastagonospora nodorum]KAH4454843.1 hypothetical protein HBH93_002270 [Parastagonospora nodorum]KAH4577786.1 hypothetical protein HBH86_001270 [Parastagonospora nodorum]KAH4888164.1 hypothetical protein HBH59_002270 [Parastagonospora nodorum]KAH4889336.1 hypothetical protein HBH58_002270 [Parastagonospora nodorum]
MSSRDAMHRISLPMRIRVKHATTHRGKPQITGASFDYTNHIPTRQRFNDAVPSAYMLSTNAVEATFGHVEMQANCGKWRFKRMVLG